MTVNFKYSGCIWYGFVEHSEEGLREGLESKAHWNTFVEHSQKSLRQGTESKAHGYVLALYVNFIFQFISKTLVTILNWKNSSLQCFLMIIMSWHPCLKYDLRESLLKISSAVKFFSTCCLRKSIWRYRHRQRLYRPVFSTSQAGV